jgi:hypothetical protein
MTSPVLLSGFVVPVVTLVSPASGTKVCKDLSHPVSQDFRGDFLRRVRIPLCQKGHGPQSCSSQGGRDGVAQEFPSFKDIFRQVGFPRESLGHKEFSGQVEPVSPKAGAPYESMYSFAIVPEFLGGPVRMHDRGKSVVVSGHSITYIPATGEYSRIRFLVKWAGSPIGGSGPTTLDVSMVGLVPATSAVKRSLIPIAMALT